MIEFISVGCFVVITWYWINSRDQNIAIIQKIFEANNLKANDQTPMFSKKRGNGYLFRLPPGLTADEIKNRKQAFEDAFPDNSIDISYKHALRIAIADPLPEEINLDDDEIGKGWSIPLGKSIEKTVRHDFSIYPHLLIAGMTRYGKSVLLNLIIYLLLRTQPNRVKFVLIDLKGGLELNAYSKTKQCQEFAKDVTEAVKALNAVKKEIEKRQALFLERGYKKIEDAEKAGEYFDRVFIIIDEAAQLNSHGVGGNEGKILKGCERMLSYCAQVGAGLGFHVIYATQYPTTQSLPQQVKANCDATISFRLRNSTASRVVFDETDKAEKLPHIRGRAIYRTNKDVEIQVFKLSDEKINEIIENNRKEEKTIEQEDVQGNKGGEDTFIIR